MSRITVAEFEAIVREQLPFAQAMGPEVMELSPECSACPTRATSCALAARSAGRC